MGSHTAQPIKYEYPSPLKGYENLPPLPTEVSEDGKSIRNPETIQRSNAYDEFTSGVTNGRRGGFDVHIYYYLNNKEQVQYAKELYERIRREFPELRIYKFWDKPVGPHVIPMFEVNILTTAQFGAFVPWLVINRGPLSALLHPNCEDGDEIRDHTQRATWLAAQQDSPDYHASTPRTYDLLPPPSSTINPAQLHQPVSYQSSTTSEYTNHFVACNSRSPSLPRLSPSIPLDEITNMARTILTGKRAKHDQRVDTSDDNNLENTDMWINTDNDELPELPPISPESPRRSSGRRRETSRTASIPDSDEDDENDVVVDAPRSLRHRALHQQKPFSYEKQKYNITKSTGKPAKSSDVEKAVKKEVTKTKSKKQTTSRTKKNGRKNTSLTSNNVHSRVDSPDTSLSMAISYQDVIEKTILRTWFQGFDRGHIPIKLGDCGSVDELVNEISSVWDWQTKGKLVTYCVIRFAWKEVDSNMILRPGHNQVYETMVNEVRAAPVWVDGTGRCDVDVDVYVD